MDETANLLLPYILAAQAQKHVTHNEALRKLDALVHLAVVDRDATAPPATPAEGDRYLLPAAPTGAWAGHGHKIAAYQDGAWAFYSPNEGWFAWVADEDLAVVWDGATWTALSGGGGGGGPSLNPATGGLVGVNATADTTNRLSVSSPAALFNHEGAGHQLKVNKAASGDTASVLFQTGFSGRAEFGTTGDDDWHVKVSPDGSTWHEALVVDRDTGQVAFPNTVLVPGGGGGVAPNVVINGDFQVNQRYFAGGALSAGVFGFDRWKAATGGANVSVSGYTVTLTSGELEQVVEPVVFGLASFASQQVTVSVEAPSQDLTVTFGSQAGTITAGSGRQSVTLTLGAGDTGNLSFKIKRAAAGSVTFARVKVEVGATATDWQARPIVDERHLCQRYFYRRDKRVSNTDVIGFLAAYTTTRCWGSLYRFPVLMRATPTVTLSGLSHIQGYMGGSKTLTGSIDMSYVTNEMMSWTTVETTSSWAVGDIIMIRFNTTIGMGEGYIDADAEL